MNSILTQKPKKNKFDLSHEVKQSGNMGTLYPCFIQDVVPGDSFRVNTQQMIRFAPLSAPMMHNVDFKLDYFFVPYRLIWDEWKDFITGGEDGNDLPSFPRITVGNSTKTSILTKGSLADYLGVPPYNATNTGSGWGNIATNASELLEISALPFRAYQLIYHEYFRDQNVGTEITQYTSSGIQSYGTYAAQCTLRNSNWEKDYFTSALPFLQRGGVVTLPLVYPDNSADFFDGTTVGDGVNTTFDDLTAGSGVDGAVSINDLRKASALQQWLELMARAGSRYREQIHAIFGERIPDYTVQVPQYLGGGKTPIMISEVLSTYKADGSTDAPQGDMTGHGLGLGDNIGFQQSFNEHGIILGLCRIIPRSSYVQGLSRFWQKFDKFDHYFPQFANLGEQEVYNREIYVAGNTTQDNAIFGYQQRYAEYKYASNRIAGDFRDSLNYWELSRRFTSAPALNQSFVECAPEDGNRIFALNTDDHQIWLSLYHSVDALRPMPYHSNPQLT